MAWNWDRVTPPTRASVAGILAPGVLKNSAPGKDGAPYVAWTYSGEAGVDHISELVDEMCAGTDISDSFNDGLFIFHPKARATSLRRRRTLSWSTGTLRSAAH